MSTNLNRVILTGHLTQDPELRSTSGGITICNLRVASNTRRKNAATGEWTDKPNYFDVTMFGAQGETAARYLTKGRGIAVDGRLDWREWQTQDGSNRQAVQIIADTVQFLGSSDRAANGQPPDTGLRATASADDDIPF
jgi:single-strand DNA-binding protein